MSGVLKRTQVMTIEPPTTMVVGFPPTITLKDQPGVELHLLRVIGMDAGYDVPVYGKSLEAAQKAAAEVIAGIIGNTIPDTNTQVIEGSFTVKTGRAG